MMVEQIKNGFPLNSLDNEELFRTIVATMGEWVYIVDREYKVIFANQAAIRLVFCDEDPIGRSVFDLFPRLSMETSRVARSLESGISFKDIVQTYYDLKGRQRASLSSIFPIKKDDKIVAVCEFGEDITDIEDRSVSVKDLKNEIKHRHAASRGRVIFGKEKFYTIDSIIGRSPGIEKLKKDIIQASASSSNLLIYGETGTGKEMVAQSVFMLSKDYKKDPFIAQNCAAIPETLLESILFGTVKGAFTGAESRPGLFESANGGIIYLDEINSMQTSLQAKMLRVIQEGRVSRVGGIREFPTNFRLISSTSISPFDLLSKKIMRSDLFYRLNVLFIEIPPLRKRTEDIPLLVDYFIGEFNQKLNRNIFGFSDEALERLMTYDWPGNVRELRNVVERCINKAANNIIDVKVLTGLRTYFEERMSKGTLDVELPNQNEKELSGRIVLRNELKRVEQSLIRKVLDRYNGNISKAARELDIPQQTLYNKLQKNGLLDYIKDNYRNLGN